MSDAVVVTIDGPTGSGKGTLSQRLASALGFHLLDSGALYRLCALAARRRGVDLDDEVKVAEIARGMDVAFELSDGDPPVSARLDGEIVDTALRSEAAGADASKVAAMAAVRGALLDRQRAFRCEPGLVADGRDMGTTVFPDAVVKFYLQASPQARARRRYNQLIAKGIGVSLEALQEDIAARDRRDSARSASPLKPAPDAVVVDTTDMNADVVFEHVLAVVTSRGVRGQR